MEASILSEALREVDRADGCWRTCGAEYILRCRHLSSNSIPPSFDVDSVRVQALGSDLVHGGGPGAIRFAAKRGPPRRAKAL